jgi:tubulin monoglycylase TTLL3/8
MKGYELYDKIYIVKGGYHDLREAFEDRGWVENPDVFSPFFDVKWTTKLYDIDYQNLEDWQIVNHFDKNQCLTSKYGLTKTIRSIFWNEGLDGDLFYPRCYDLADLTDFEDFIEDYKLTKVRVFC